MKRLRSWVLAVAVLAALASAVMLLQTGTSGAIQLDVIRLPPGFSIDIYAANVPNARSLALASDGTVFAGSMNGVVSAVIDRDRDGRADEVVKVAGGLRMPNGVAFKDGSLYVAEVSRVIRYDGILDALKQPASRRAFPRPVVVYDKFPTDSHHGWKYLSFGPDGLLYLQIGAPCNICDPPEPYASLLRMNADGSGVEIVARGVRNSVGQAWHPDTKELWFTDNGRDNLGDDSPPDELNRLSKIGEHFGYPYCHGATIPDPEYGRGHPCANYTPPAQALGPHVAAIGMKFYTGSMFPPEYRKQIFIAEHGSWNRSTPIGYRISVVRLEGSRSVKYETFAEGWLQGRRAWGRPVDVLELPDGSLLVSDDSANAIYRVTYRK